jgi:hypothetical protein
MVNVEAEQFFFVLGMLNLSTHDHTIQYFEDIKSEVAVELNVVSLDAFRNCKF